MTANNEIKPIREDSVNIVLSTDENFAPFCAVAIQSIIDTANADNFYDILIMSDNIKEHTKGLILKLVNNYNNISIRFINIDFDFSRYNIIITFAIQTYYRLLLPELLKDYSKIIYIDCDIIVKQDISDLFTIDIHDNFIGGVRDPYLIGLLNKNGHELSKYDEKKSISQDNINNYINAGILILNLDKIRSLYTVSDIFKFSENKYLKWPDQTIINSMFQGKIHILPAEWNVIPIIFENDKKSKIASCAPQEIYSEYVNSVNNPKLIHFASGRRPWTEPDCLLNEEFWRVARKTVFYELILYKMSKHNTNETIYDLYKKNIFFRIYRFCRNVLGKIF